MTLDYEAMLDRILESGFAETWGEERGEMTEIEFQGWMISAFFQQDLPEIVRVLPELWTEIEVEVKHTLTYDILGILRA